MNTTAERRSSESSPERAALAERIRSLPAREAAALVERALPEDAVDALLQMNPAIAQGILRELDSGPRRFLSASAPAVRGMVREEKQAWYQEKGNKYDTAPFWSQNAVLELVSFTPGP